MRIKIICIGKTTEAYLEEGIENYLKRLKHYARVELLIVPALKNTKNINQEQQKNQEGELILSKINSQDYLILLDEKGGSYTSRGLAKHIEHLYITHGRTLVFVIGGAYGFSQAIYDRANEIMSLSLLTFSHQMVRLVWVEQLYRAMTINKGEPYHHD